MPIRADRNETAFDLTAYCACHALIESDPRARVDREKEIEAPADGGIATSDPDGCLTVTNRHRVPATATRCCAVTFTVGTALLPGRAPSEHPLIIITATRQTPLRNASPRPDRVMGIDLPEL